MIKQLSLFDNDIPQIGQKIQYISCGKKYNGIVKGYSYGNKYIDCTTNQKGFSGVSLHILNKGKNWFVK
ncbi:MULTISPECIES: hypothetical protein [Clostridium]|uniref:Uncharacterized protein n=1 Tax=Clostridium sporogenes TaxID=1509 RepID=A0A1L3NHE6_CLOSG|nr:MULTISPECIES: hypothetical protein [Clostridium]APH15501.1 hypothetical protein NPD5_3914 [Clostridium sporogenes]MBD5639475.1 hypothetical protein [Clostridium botulinum]MDI6918979.1 hypothetical protein [Clostridium botulinum]WMU99803.1 hypothetical protein QA656_19410 [Clostridium botulinum]